MKNALSSIAVAMLAAMPVAAHSASWYAGLAAGQSRTSHDLVANRESTITLATDVHTDFDATANAWKAFGGYRLNDYLAFEATYADLGSHRMNTTLLGGDPPAPASIVINRGIAGYGVDALVGAPLGPHFSVFARAGVFRARLDADATLAGNIEFSNGAPGETFRRTTLTENVPHFGAGGAWHFERNLSLRLEWERYHNVGKAFAIGAHGTTGEADTDAVSIGLLMRF